MMLPAVRYPSAWLTSTFPCTRSSRSNNALIIPSTLVCNWVCSSAKYERHVTASSKLSFNNSGMGLFLIVSSRCSRCDEVSVRLAEVSQASRMTSTSSVVRGGTTLSNLLPGNSALKTKCSLNVKILHNNYHKKHNIPDNADSRCTLRQEVSIEWFWRSTEVVWAANQVAALHRRYLIGRGNRGREWEACLPECISNTTRTPQSVAWAPTTGSDVMTNVNKSKKSH